VGNGQPATRDRLIAIEKKIEVERARAVPRLALSRSARGGFAFSEKGEKGRSGERRPSGDDRVEKVGLGREGRHGRRFIER